MKPYPPFLKVAIREKIRWSTGTDPGSVHPEFLLSHSGGGIQTERIKESAHQTCCLAVHFLPIHPSRATRWISFNLN